MTKINHEKSITKVFILYTGGTIGMAPKDETDPNSPLEPKSLERLMHYLPGIEGAKTKDENQITFWLPNRNIVKIGCKSFASPVDSSNIKPEDWIEMAKQIYEVYDEYDGFIILHGTDTMAYTASGLSFIFANLAKPIILTGSQLPISAQRTDAVLNVVNAIYIAGYKATDLPVIPEVVIVFADKIIRGCRASKISTSDWAGFDSPNFPLLGTIGEYININTNYLLKPPSPSKKFSIYTDLCNRVLNIGLFPGLNNSQIKRLFTDVEGIVLNTYGTGNAPKNPEFYDIIRKAIEKGKIVLGITQCTVGMVELGLYEASSELLDSGVISGIDMTPEAAIAKLMWTLGSQYGEGRITQLQINQRGEQTENLFDLKYGGLHKNEAKSISAASVCPDGRLDRNRISKAVLRFSGLGVEGVSEGENVQIRVFMNMPNANHETHLSEERFIASFDFKWSGVVETKIKQVTYKVQNVIGDGDVILTFVTHNENIKVFYKGLYLAIYSSA